MENNAIRVFEFEMQQVRVVEVGGEPWWVLKDICDVLGLSNSRIVADRLDGDDVSQTYIIDSLGRQQQTSIVNESGLYNVILRSDKPEAKTFKRWVTHEVLPQIRKHGAYMTPQKIEEALMNPDTIIKLAVALKEEQAKARQLRQDVEENKPKVLFADSVAASDGLILIGEMAKLLRQNGIDIGEKRLFDWLRENGYLMKIGASRNMPTQWAMDQGIFRVLERTIDNPNGSIRITKTTKVTGKGQIYFIQLFLSKKAA